MAFCQKIEKNTLANRAALRLNYFFTKQAQAAGKLVVFYESRAEQLDSQGRFKAAANAYSGAIAYGIAKAQINEFRARKAEMLGYASRELANKGAGYMQFAKDCSNPSTGEFFLGFGLQSSESYPQPYSTKAAFYEKTFREYMNAGKLRLKAAQLHIQICNFEKAAVDYLGALVYFGKAENAAVAIGDREMRKQSQCLKEEARMSHESCKGLRQKTG